MPTNQSTSERRRRVLYSSRNDAAPSTAASRRAKEKLREARQPTKAYGAKVQRRLRGRWFSIVPVKSRTLCTWTAIITSVSLLFAYAHYASVTWPSLAYAPEIARPLRLDRPDSFGRWFICMLLVGSSGVSLLIYQLRRYRNDDFRGQYRLWRLVIFVLLLTSVNSLVSFVDWAGGLLDWMFGRRVAFSGYDWLRIVLGLAGVVLALRMVAEVRRSRWALACLLLACGFLALPEATKWQLVDVETIQRWAIITAAPLLGYTALFLGLTGYLRMLYREVRGIQDEAPLLQRWQNYRAGRFAQKDDEQEEASVREPRKKRRRRAAPEPEEYEPEDDYQADSDHQEVAAEEETSDDAVPARRKRRWFGLRAAKSERAEQSPNQSDYEDESVAAEPVAAEPPPRKKKRRFGLRLDPTESTEDTGEEIETDDAVSDEETPKRKRGFGLSWRKKKPKPKVAELEEAEDNHDESYDDNHQQPIAQETRDNHGDDELDPDNIDWDSLSKSERRRLRKKLKRQGRAA